MALITTWQWIIIQREQVTQLLIIIIILKSHNCAFLELPTPPAARAFALLPPMLTLTQLCGPGRLLIIIIIIIIIW